ncbi:glycoside hydrolase family 2 protein [Acidisoma silvae]|uniref:Glycoside hydrolase family 2 protein n=2 Tax=Acidisoma silvae TaxID=2802396 RepID=A0A963YXK9_9PROT|nr:glycoside hydrolase family 2 protein [Acidisoma silvae]MCB8878150.1 glycoside hydrolase family 2 protein [Acidisoma silvae]
MPLHEDDVWYETAFEACPGQKLRFLGLAGLAEVWIDGECVAVSTSMFLPLAIDLATGGTVRLSICFRSLFAAMAATSERPRWRTRLVTTNALRLYRQTLLGHMPGWCPSFHAIGPFRPVELVDRPGILQSWRFATHMRGNDGILSVNLTFSGSAARFRALTLSVGTVVFALEDVRDGSIAAEVTLPDVARWWPHTHGEAILHMVSLSDGTTELALGQVGFREATIRRGEDETDFALEMNGVSVFCRGACWTSADLLGLAGDREAYAPWLIALRDSGMNMVRVGGTMLYESQAFHDLCDELGIMVWQDLMFANLDYPLDSEPLRQQVIAEVEQLLSRLGGSPSFVVLCGGSEIAQQATMVGLTAERRQMPFFETVLPRLIRHLSPDLHYIPHSPWGGALPITVSAGVAHYYGVGAYRRPLEDARRAKVRFASECLAFANPPSSVSPAALKSDKAPRDHGVSWDFADIRDHYLGTLYGYEPVKLRLEDHARYLELSRAVTADLMESVFSEWRRPGSPCSGGLVWQLQDLASGSGWGVIDSHGHKKAAWHGLRRVLAPIQLLLSDEGMDGIALHVLNESPDAVSAVLSLDCLRRGAVSVVSAQQPVEIEPRSSASFSSQAILDSFFDITRAYHFGAPEHNVTIATLRCAKSGNILSEAFHFPVGRALPPDDLGMQATIVGIDSCWFIDIIAARFAQAVHIVADGYQADEDWFHLPPARPRRIRLREKRGWHEPPSGLVIAINGTTTVSFRAPRETGTATRTKTAALA